MGSTDEREMAIWNRATAPPPPELERPGDRALQAIFFVDGQIMNGGLDSAVEYRSADEILRAADGFAYFGRDDVAALLREALEAGDERIEQLDDRYSELVDRPGLLDRMFRDRLASHPEDFAPVD
jgi:hypothetical protein